MYLHTVGAAEAGQLRGFRILLLSSLLFPSQLNSLIRELLAVAVALCHLLPLKLSSLVHMPMNYTSMYQYTHEHHTHSHTHRSLKIEPGEIPLIAGLFSVFNSLSTAIEAGRKPRVSI